MDKKQLINTVRFFLLVLIILGVGLLVTQAYWVPSLVDEILSHEQSPLVERPATTTPAVPAEEAPVVHQNVPPTQASGGVDGTVTIGPTCPVVREGEDCADRPYRTTLVLASTVTGKNGGVLVFTDAQGRFSRDLAPGTYTLRAQSDAVMPRLAPVTFTVEADKRTRLLLQFDSGIR